MKRDRVKKICFYGPESTGKSTLAKYVAQIYDAVFVPEVAREFIADNNFTIEEIIQIGQAQTERILEATTYADKIIFCDTDLITTQIYSRYYLNTIPAVLFELEKAVSFDLYFLMDIDVPWIADGLRDLGNRRQEMFDVFKHELEIRDIPYTLVRGDWEARKDLVKKKIDLLISDQ